MRKLIFFTDFEASAHLTPILLIRNLDFIGNSGNRRLTQWYRNLNSFHDHGDALSASDASRRQCVTTGPPLQFMQHGEHESCASCS